MMSQERELIPTPYYIIKQIGEGAHGSVYLGMKEGATSDFVALKRIAPIQGFTSQRRRGGDDMSEDEIPRFNPELPEEITILQTVRHENIIYLMEVLKEAFSMTLVFPYIPYSLEDVILHYSVSKKIIPLTHTKDIMRQCVSALAYLHSFECNIMHRDIKPSNILITNDGICKLCDFGLATRFYGRTTFSHQIASRWYRSPESLYGARAYTKSVDLWSIGCVFGELVKGCPLFPGTSDIDQLALVISNLGSPTSKSWPQLTSLPDFGKISFDSFPGKSWEAGILPQGTESYVIQFIRAFLLYDESRRLPAHEALKHDFFNIPPLPARLTLPMKAESLKVFEEKYKSRGDGKWKRIFANSV